MIKMELRVELGNSFWFGIAFAAGCFGFSWTPFFLVFVLFLIHSILEIGFEVKATEKKDGKKNDNTRH